MHVATDNRRWRGRSSPVLPTVAVLVVLAGAGAAGADRTSFWTQDSFESFEDGSLDGTSVRSDGAIVIAPELETFELPLVQYAWAAGRRDGDIVLSAGSPGVVYELGEGGVRELFSSDTSDCSAFVVAPSGDIYLGTSPGGEVYRIGRDGSPELFFETGEGYVWSMAYSSEHGLLVGTGDLARVFAVDSDGVGRVLYESSEASISAISICGARVIAGTSVSGLLLDVTPGSDLKVLYDSPHDEISGIAQGDDGRVYFAATSVSLEDAMNEGPQYDSGFGDGAVYRTTGAGGAVRLWESPSHPVTALGRGASGGILAGTGERGLLYSISDDGHVDLVADLDGEMVLSMSASESGLLICSGLPGGVAVLRDRAASTGVYLSDVLDTRSASVWGEMEWQVDMPDGGGIRMSARSGNTEVPDDTWSEWCEISGSEGGHVECPGSRYAQWRATLAAGSGRKSPVLRRVTLAYLRENLPPRIGEVEVLDPDDVVTESGGNGTSVSQTLPSGVDLTYSLDASPADARALPVLVRGMRTVSWEAVDPNGDALSYEVWVRAEDESEWRPMDRDIMWRTLHTWDTQSMADGVYRVRVIASDAPANPRSSALTAEGTSAPFLVDHSPPVIGELDIERRDGVLVVTGRADDGASPVVYVEVALDYGEWRGAFASDGIFDSRSELFRLEIEDAAPGEHTVAVRAIDRAGNVAIGRELTR